MPEDRSQKEEALLRAIMHPLRARVLRSVRRGHSSATDIARALEAPRSSVNEQLRHLSKAGLIYVSEVKNKRGAVQRFYRVHSDSDYFSESELEKIDVQGRKRIDAGIVRMFLTAMAAAMQSENHASPSSVFWSITRLVDEEAWQQLRTLHRETALQANQLIHEAEERLDRESGSEARVISSSVFLFELPKEE